MHMNYHRVTAIAFVVLMLLSATAATIGFSTGTASAATSGDWQYEPVTGTNGVRITGYTGPGGVVTVPSDIEGKSVTTIGFAAFRHINSITSVTIPNSVTTMGESAFAFCTGLTSVYIGLSLIHI